MRRGIVYLVFGASIVASLLQSYLHLADWFAAWLPQRWSGLAYVSAIALESSVVSGLIALRATGPSRQTATLIGAGLGASVYANSRWAIGAIGLPLDELSWLDWADVVASSTILPVLAVVAVHVMAEVLDAIDASDSARAERRNRRERARTRAKARRTRTSPSPAAPPSARPSAPSGDAGGTDRETALAMIATGQFDELESQAALARALGVAPSTITRWPVQRSGERWVVAA